MDDLGPKIKYLRKKNGYSLRKFGSVCNLSHSYISDIENGRTNPSLQTLQIIAENLNTSMSYLLGESNNQFLNKEKYNHDKECCCTVKDCEIIGILNENPKLKQEIYELKNTSTKKIDIFLKTWDFIKSMYEDLEK